MTKGDQETARILVSWLQVLNQGYVKPDVNNSKMCDGDQGLCCNHTGVVRDTKDYREHIRFINDKLQELAEK